jgi:lipoprotein-anchoring transpeptidase ErfK/SrfK
VVPPAVAAPSPQAGSLDIPPEFVGEASPENEAGAEAESPPEAASAPAPEELETSPAARPARPDNSVRKLALVIGAAVLIGVLAAGAYAFWGRSSKAPVRTSVTTPTANAPSSSAPTLRPAVREPERPTADGDNMPYILRRQLVYYRTTQPPGTWIISKSQNFLYVVRPNSTAMRYTIGMGPDCSDASGLYQISRKEGPPEGRLLYLGDSKFRIKQASTPITIGRMSPSPGFQLVADDFTDLYDNGDVGTRVVVAN